MSTHVLDWPEMRPERRPFYILLAALIVVGVIIGTLILHKHRVVALEARQRREHVAKGPRVAVIVVQPAPETVVLDLQGEARPYFQTTVYAKINGFLTDISVDKGDRVKKNQIIGHIESPETDRQVLAAQANAINQRAIAARNRLLASKDYIPEQDFETSQALAQSLDQTVRQLKAVRGYEVLRAPFDGIVVARYADPGALLSGAPAQPVIAVAHEDRMRVYAYVDQSHAISVQLGDPAQILFPFAREPVTAQVSRIAGALDPRTRMLLVEMDLFHAQALMPGGFVDVKLKIHVPPAYSVPSETLVTRDDQPYVAVIARDDTLHFRKVVVLDDDGVTARLAAGVRPGERLAVGIGVRVAEGGKVQPIVTGKH